MNGRAPENNCGRDPLKGHSGSVESEALLLGGGRQLHELANATPPEQRNGDAEKNKDRCEIPVHGKKIRTLLERESKSNRYEPS